MVEAASFPWDRLPNVPAAALGPLRAVARLCRHPSGWTAPREAVEEAIPGALRVRSTSVRWVDVHEVPDLADALVAARIELPFGLAVLEVDPTLACRLVEAVLGKSEPADAAFRPLGEGELGVLAYLAARALARTSSASRLLGWTTDPRALAVVLRREPWIAASFAVEALGGVGVARLWLPARATLVEPSVLDLEERWTRLPVDLVAEVGRVRLSSGELAGLGRGDVVLLDDADARPEDGRLRGRARIRVRGARRARTTGILREDGRTVAIDREADEEEVVPMGQSTRSGAEPGNAAMVAEIPVEIAVELGRVRVTVAEVSALAPGEVLVLDRGPGDPVTLTIDDRSLARGELVLVDGRVGVRILDVSGPSR